MTLACSGMRENLRGGVFQRAQGGLVFVFSKQNEIDNRGGAHQQSSPQSRLLRDAQKVSEIAGVALRQCHTEESDAGRSPAEPVEGFAENAAQMGIGGRVEDFTVGGGFVREFLKVAGDAGNDGLVS